MTEETAIEKLDYTKPPPGYTLVRDVDGFLFIDSDGKRHASAMHNLGGDWREEVALHRAWAQYKAHNDPPGMRVIGTGDRDQPFGGVRHFFLSHTGSAENAAARAEARAAAWAWHDRRHALAGRLTLQDAWPRCLRWTNAECDQVDRWIADGEETPECFWVRLKPIELDLANYEQTGSPFDAETMWTCRACRGRPHKSQQVSQEGPEYVRHAPGCKVARSEAVRNGGQHG